MTDHLSTLIAPVLHSVCLIEVERLEAVKKEVAEVLIQVSCEYPPVQAVRDSAAVHGLTDKVAKSAPGQRLVASSRGLQQSCQDVVGVHITTLVAMRWAGTNMLVHIVSSEWGHLSCAFANVQHLQLLGLIMVHHQMMLCQHRAG